MIENDGSVMPGKRILIADNDALIRELLRHALEAEGYEVTLASDGLEAWHMLQRDPPDYLVLDLVMPNLDGTRLCHYVKTDPRLASLRVFVLTATAAETAPRLSELGAAGYLAKRTAPEMVRELLQALRSAETGGTPEIPPPSAGVAGGHPRQIVSELLAERTHMNAILQHLGEGVLLLDAAGEVFLANPAAVAILGRSEGELLGLRFTAMLDDQGGSAVEEALRGIASGATRETVRLELSHDGRTLLVTVTGLFERGALMEYVLLLQDITERTRAEEGLRERVRQLEAVRAVGLEIARTLDLPTVLDLILRRAEELVGATSAAVFLLQQEEEEEEEVLRPVSWHGLGDWMKGLRIKRGQGIVGLVAERREGIIVNDYRTSPLAVPEILQNTTVTAAMGEPLIIGDRLPGVLVLDNQDMGRPFTSQDEAAVRLFTAQAAIAITNARQYQQIMTHAVRGNAMLGALRSLLSGADLQGCFDGIVVEASGLVESSIVKVMLVDREAGGLRVRAMSDATSVSLNSLIPSGVGLSGIVAATGEPLFVPNCPADPRNVFGTRDQELGIVTYLGLPIKIGDEVLGVMTFNTTIPRRYSAEDIAFLISFADQAAIAIERSRLHDTIHRHAATLEVRVQEHTAELERALQVKTDFLANLSHELRTPLNPILGFTELLQEQAGDRLTERQAGYLARIRESGEHLLALITALLDYTRLDVGGLTLKPEPLDLQALLEAATGEIRAQAVAKKLVLTLQVAESLPPLVADPFRLKQIFAHLLANAVKFTPSGGRITVTARRICDFRFPIADLKNIGSEPQSQIANQKSQMCDFVEIAVADTGIGITAEDLPKLFTPLTQLEQVYTKQYQGLGMGLALTKRLVELHGGRIWAESAGAGQGARFIVCLPLRAIPRAKRILVVEDEAPVLEALVAVLASAGYAVEQAERGAQALAALAASPPDLLVLDIGLPDVDGWEILKRVRGAEQTRDLRILVLTGLEHVDANQALALGADEFLTKPVSPRVLVETVGCLFRRASLATPLPG